jgi:hypothetical protein
MGAHTIPHSPCTIPPPRGMAHYPASNGGNNDARRSPTPSQAEPSQGPQVRGSGRYSLYVRTGHYRQAGRASVPTTFSLASDLRVWHR